MQFDMNSEIGRVETRGRRKRAVVASTPKRAAPASASIATFSNEGGAGGGQRDTDTQDPCALAGQSSTEIGSSETKIRRKRARLTVTPTILQPASAPIASSSNGGGVGEGQGGYDTQHHFALAQLINDLVSSQRKRVFSIVQKSRSDRSIESLIATVIGFKIEGNEKERKEIFAQAKAFRLAVEKGEEHPKAAGLLRSYVPTILASAETRKTWDKLQDQAEKDMEALAKMLPVYYFVKSVKGFGLVGLAAICAEAGIPIGDYRTVSGLWKRMGLAVINGERQQRKRGTDEAKAHGYAPKRRSQVWQFFSDSMFRHQWVADKDEDGKDPKKTDKPVAVPAHPAGPYGEVYRRRMAHTAPRILATEDLDAKDPARWSAGRCHNDARRVMSKAVLRDLWRVWRGLPPRGFAEPDEQFTA